MGLRFRRRLGIAPGVLLNLGKRSASLSLGRRGAHVTIGPAGMRETVGLPGTGVSYTRTQARPGRRQPGFLAQLVNLAIGLLMIWLLLAALGVV